MQSDDNVLTFTPEPISELIDTLPAKGILILIKNQPILSRRIFLGFSAREKSLALPVVRQRLETELHKQPEFSESLLKLWQQIYADLIKVIISDTFQPTPEILTSLVHDYGKPAVHFALSHAQSEDLRQYADQLPEIEPETKVHDVSPPSPEYTKKDQRIAETSQQLQDITQERDTLKHEVAQLKKQLVELSTQLKDTLESKSEIEKRLTREQRRSKNIEEEYERLRKDINQQAKRLNEETEAPHIPDEIVLSVTEAVSLLQKSLAAMTGSQSNEATQLVDSVPTQISPIATPKAPVVQSRIVDKDLTFPTAHGKRTYSLSQILTRLRRNDEELLTVMRDGIARLANNPERERAIIADLTKAGVPAALLTGPLHPAVIDGSNVANIDASQRRARYAYLRQIRRAAWREGYFPVIIVVDASLRHQIDRADILMERVDTGDIVMAPAGSSADQLLIDEAKRLHAVLITNDRMNDWPAAKNLEKRHVELIGGTVCIGSFHRANPAWFH